MQPQPVLAEAKTQTKRWPFFSFSKSRANVFSQVAERYLEWGVYGRENPFTEATLISYKKGIRQINKVFGEKLITEIDKEDVTLLRKSILQRDDSLNYLHKILCLVRSILRYCRDELDMMDVLRPEKIKLPTVIKGDVEFYSIEQLVKIFNAIHTFNIQGIRLMAVLTAFLDSGVRIRELLSLDRKQIECGDGSAVIEGKGRKIRKIYFREWSLNWIRQYLSLRIDDNPALFVTHRGDHITRLHPDNVRKMLRHISKVVGFAVRPHRMRKTFATHLFYNGVDIRSLQVLLGHSNIEVTTRYIGENPIGLRNVVNQKINYGQLENFKAIPGPVWSKNHVQCIACGQTRRPHLARGLCDLCYMNARNHKTLDKTGVLLTAGVYSKILILAFALCGISCIIQV